MDARLQYLTAADKVKLYYELWIPSHAEAIVIFIHDFGDHVGRHSGLIKHLTKCNYGVCAFDLRGHGRSGGRRSHVKSFSVFLKDLSQIIEMIQSEHPTTPLFLAGRGLGGQVAISFVARYSKGLRGLIVLSPGIEPLAEFSKWKKKSVRFLSSWLPIVKFQTEISPQNFSRDEAVVEGISKDPLINWHMTARMANEITKNVGQLPKMAFQVKVPCLFMHGGDDRICSIDGTRKFYHSVLVQNKEFKTYSGSGHELLNETGHEKILRDIVSWLSSQLVSFKRIARAGNGRTLFNAEDESYGKETMDLWHNSDNNLHHH